MTSKAARIRALYAQGVSTREIADQVDCRPEYVRVVARQRVLPGSVSVSDLAYRKTDAYKARHRAYQRQWQRQRYRTDPTWRADVLARNKAVYHQRTKDRRETRHANQA